MELEMKMMTKKAMEKAIPTTKKMMMNVSLPFVIHRTIAQVLENHLNLLESVNIDNSLLTNQKFLEIEQTVDVSVSAFAVVVVVPENNGLPEN